jgi:hypothetical protein
LLPVFFIVLCSRSISDWESDALTSRQILYAAADAFYSRKLGLLFTSKGFVPKPVSGVQQTSIPILKPPKELKPVKKLVNFKISN